MFYLVPIRSGMFGKHLTQSRLEFEPLSNTFSYWRDQQLKLDCQLCTLNCADRFRGVEVTPRETINHILINVKPLDISVFSHHKTN